MSEWEAPHGRLRANLTDDQRDAVLDGLFTRVQLLKGPPGTGKTVTTATAVLAKATSSLRAGSVVLLTAHTHRAVDTLMERRTRFRDLAGDNRQLVPIARQSALTFTFRLPPLIRELIARVYDLDEIELQGSDSAPAPAAEPAGEPQQRSLV